MRCSVTLGMLVLFSVNAYAQQRGAGSPPGGRPPAVNPSGFRNPLPGTRPGLGPRPSVAPDRFRHAPAGQSYFVPYPVYVGSPDSAAYGPETASPDPPQLPEFPPVVSQPMVQPVVEESLEDSFSTLVESATISRERARREWADSIRAQANFFIALKGLVCTGIAYWIQGDILHYITSLGSHNQVSLVLVDRAMSAKLNAGRPVNLVLPPARPTVATKQTARQKETAPGAAGASSRFK